MYTLHSLLNFFPQLLARITSQNTSLIKEFSRSTHTFSFHQRPKKRVIYLELTGQEILTLKNTFKLLHLNSKVEIIFDLNHPQPIDLAVFSSTSLRKGDPETGIITAWIKGIPITDLQTLLQELHQKVDLETFGIWSYLHRSSMQHSSVLAYSVIKSVIDPLIAVLLLAILLPVLALISAGIWLSDGRPLFYTQVRTGYRGKPFTLIKFRSMPVDAERNGPQFSSENDNRAYPFGQWLRKTRLDELPQLFNVIRGELRLVGPRPERPEFYKKFKHEIRYFQLRTTVFPGITGWAQLRSGYAASVEESKTKLEYDLHYILKMSPKLDFLILMETAILLFKSLTPKRISRRDRLTATPPITPLPARRAKVDSYRCTFADAKTKPKTQYG